jgi:hypothetical protein
MFGDGLQHDAHELFRCLTCHIDSAAEQLDACRRDLFRAQTSLVKLKLQNSKLMKSVTQVDELEHGTKVDLNLVSKPVLNRSTDGPVCNGSQLNVTLKLPLGSCSSSADEEIHKFSYNAVAPVDQFSLIPVDHDYLRNVADEKLRNLLHTSSFKVSGRKVFRRSSRKQKLALKRSMLGRSISLVDVSVSLEPLSLSHIRSSWSATSVLRCDRYSSPEFCSTPSGFCQRRASGCNFAEVFSGFAECKLDFDSVSPHSNKEFRDSVAPCREKVVSYSEGQAVTPPFVDETGKVFCSNLCMDVEGGQPESGIVETESSIFVNHVFSQLDAIHRGKTCRVELERVDAANIVQNISHIPGISCAKSSSKNKNDLQCETVAKQYQNNIDGLKCAHVDKGQQLGNHAVSVSNVFGGKLAMVTHCLSCGDVTERIETYEDIALAVHRTKKGYYLL